MIQGIHRRHKITSMILVLALLIMAVSCTTIEPEEGGSDKTKGVEDNKANDPALEQGTSDNTNEAVEEKKELLIWSYSDEFLTEIYEFEALNNCIVHVEIQEVDGYIPMLNGVVKGNLEETPDLVLLNEEDLHSEVMAEHLVDLKTVFDQEQLGAMENDMFPYVYLNGLNDEGQLLGLSYQVTPIGGLYRRSYAQEAIGLDDPESLKEYFKSYDQLLELAEGLKDHGVYLTNDIYGLEAFAHLGDINYLDEDGFFVNDDELKDYLNFVKTCRLNGYMGNLTKWSDEWLQSMASTAENTVESTEQDLANEQVFLYILPNWAITNVMMLVGDDDQVVTASEDGFIKVFNDSHGDWGMIPLEPAGYFGSSYLGLLNTSDEKELGAEFIQYMTMDEDHARSWLQDSYMMSSNMKIQGEQDFSIGNDFLGGQNYHDSFGQVINNIKESNITDSNEILNRMIDLIYQEIVHSFIKGEYHTVTEAVRSFEGAVAESFPESIGQEAVEGENSQD